METAATEAMATTMTANLSVMDLIHQGWYATYPLILSSIVMTSIVVERLWTLGKIGTTVETLTEEVCRLLRGGELERASSVVTAGTERSPASRIYAALLPLIGKVHVEGVLELGERRRLEENRILKRNIWVLGTIGASAPFIGLFGTVVGIIKSFHQMAVMGTGGFSVVAAGISEALVATALGLVVAIIAVIFYNYLQIKVGNLDALLRVGLGKVLEAAQLGGIHGSR